MITADDFQLNDFRHQRNTRAIFESLESGELRRLILLSNRIEYGGASESEAETTAVYEGFVTLCAQLHDLAQMVRRREEFIIAKGFDPRQYGEIDFVSQTVE